MTFDDLKAAYQELGQRVQRLEAELQRRDGKHRKQATRIPEDFKLTVERIAAAQKEGVADAFKTFEHFTLYWRAKAGADARKVDWDATWRIWCMNTRKTFQQGAKAGSYDDWASKHSRNEDLGFG